MRKPLLAVVTLLALAPAALAQLPPDNAGARLRQRTANPPATLPTSRPTTRPSSMKDAHRIVFLVDTRLSPQAMPYLRRLLR